MKTFIITSSAISYYSHGYHSSRNNSPNYDAIKQMASNNKL